MTESKIRVRARFIWGNGEVEADVVNPGAELRSGDSVESLFLIYAADCYSPPLYVCEGGTEEALEVFLYDTGVGKTLQVEWDSPEADEYFFNVNPGDQIGGRTFEEKGKISVSGRVFVPGEETYGEPHTTGGGDLYDIENVEMKELNPKKVRYFGEGLPPDGIRPDLYSTWVEQDWEGELGNEWTEDKRLFALYERIQTCPEDTGVITALGDGLKEFWAARPEAQPRSKELMELIIKSLQMGRPANFL